MRTIVWFRGKDLRVGDHAPLTDAIRTRDVIPLFVLDPYFFAPERARELPRRIQFLLESLVALERAIERLGSRLLVVEGKSVDVVPRLARAWRADRVVAQRWTEPFARERDRRVAAALEVPFQLFEGELLHCPGTLRTGAGEPFSVFTAFARAFARTVDVGAPLPPPKRLSPLPAGIHADTVRIPTCQDLGIARTESLLHGSEPLARTRLRSFLKGPAAHYDELRNRLDLARTSRLSADLHFGTLSVREVWTAAGAALAHAPRALASFRNELVWREFAHATLWDRPELLSEPFRPQWRDFPWIDDEQGWRAWVDGTTGYPIVDAAARQLLGEGFVHNRARMIAASFLTKHLLIDYHRGEQHYLKYLVDGDWANNNAGWQWATGCGLDAQPYFRVFNPTTQGEKFDPTGAYVRRWVPELARLPDRWLHQPSEAPEAVLRAAGVTLDVTYPRAIVDHALARQRFLALASEHLGSGRGRGTARPRKSAPAARA